MNIVIHKLVALFTHYISIVKTHSTYIFIKFFTQYGWYSAFKTICFTAFASPLVALVRCSRLAKPLVKGNK